MLTSREQNYTTLIQAWDFRAGSDFVAHMRDATARCHRTIAVLSANYLRSDNALVLYISADGDLFDRFYRATRERGWRSSA